MKPDLATTIKNREFHSQLELMQELTRIKNQASATRGAEKTLQAEIYGIQQSITMKANVDLEISKQNKKRCVKDLQGLRSESNRASENYYLAFYLFALANQGLIQYPFSFYMTESPDCIIENSIGLEITRATEAEYQRAHKEACLKNLPNWMHDNKGAISYEPEQQSVAYAYSQIVDKDLLINSYLEAHPGLKKIDLLISLESDHILEPKGLEMILRTQPLPESQFRNIAIIGAIQSTYTIFYFNHERELKVLITPNF